MIRCQFIVICLVISLPSLASDWQSFCSQVKTSTETPQTIKEEDIKKIGEIITAKQAKRNWDDFKRWRKTKGLVGKRWIFVDARAPSDRIAGMIPRAILMTADSENPKLNEVSETNFITKTNNLLKEDFQTIAEFKDLSFIVFCNGKTCKRAVFSACQMRTFGLKKDQVNIMLEGFPKWISSGYPVRLSH